MHLNGNFLSGAIPSEFGLLSNLDYLDISENQLSGGIIKQLGNLVNLKYLNLSVNRLSEEIPVELSRLSNLSQLDLSNNLLMGPIPSSLSGLESLETLNISHNNLSGKIPDSFKDMRGLKYVDISYNELQGPIPENDAFRDAGFDALKGNKGLCGDVEGLKPCNLTENNQNETKKTTIIIVVSAAILLIICICTWVFLRPRKSRKYANDNDDNDMNEITSAESLQYDFNTINVATNNFSHANKLGQGGFGAVYKGTLMNGQEVAVKRLAMNSGQADLEFKNEVVLVAKLQHRNLVRLLGFCFEGVERLLIYEFVPNKSPDHFIFDPIKRTNLDWEKRYKIIVGIARGLLYLHEDSRIRIIHRDLKANKVLLDAEMNPKISDFGMARLFAMDQTEGATNRIVGTYGYMAPEYALYGQFSVKSDVSSFGVMVLEIVTGRKVILFKIFSLAIQAF